MVKSIKNKSVCLFLGFKFVIYNGKSATMVNSNNEWEYTQSATKSIFAYTYTYMYSTRQWDRKFATDDNC